MYFQKRLSPVSYHREGHVAFSRQNAKPEPEVHVEHGGETARLQRLSKELEPDDWVPGLATRRVIGHLRNDCQNEEARTKLTKLEKRGQYHVRRHNPSYYFGSCPAWCHSDVGAQPGLGLRSFWNRGCHPRRSPHLSPPREDLGRQLRRSNLMRRTGGEWEWVITRAGCTTD
jgi:hypothetical protein